MHTVGIIEKLFIRDMVKVVTYINVGTRGEKRRFLKSEKNNQNSESKEVLVFTHSPR